MSQGRTLLAKWMVENDMLQQEMADLTGFSQTTISDAILGTHLVAPSSAFVMQIASVTKGAVPPGAWFKEATEKEEKAFMTSREAMAVMAIGRRSK